jgi:PAS domain S-box-containing protein
MKIKILIADDEPLNLLLYAEMIKSAGYIAICAKDGMEAIDVCTHERPDLVILDWNMPRLDGLSALIEIKSIADLSEIPVVMITGIMTTPENLQTALEAGAIDFIRKPFDKIELLARVNSILAYSKSKLELRDRYNEIEENHHFIKSLMESIPNPLVYYDLDGLIMGCNQKFESLIGLKWNELEKQSVYRSWFFNQSTNHKENDKRLLLDQQEQTYESECGLENRKFLLSKTVFKNRSGTPQGIMCVLTDITELKSIYNQIIETKKKELTSSALRLIHLSETNNNLIRELEEVNQYTNKKGSELIRQIIVKFNSQSNQSFWNEFESRFENVYESFYQKLTSLYPDLTPGERKLCALLRLNLSSKDIAALTFQNSQSIDVARYRLRKKLNLSQEENLTDFLMSL